MIAGHARTPARPVELLVAPGSPSKGCTPVHQCAGRSMHDNVSKLEDTTVLSFGAAF